MVIIKLTKCAGSVRFRCGCGKLTFCLDFIIFATFKNDLHVFCYIHMVFCYDSSVYESLNKCILSIVSVRQSVTFRTSIWLLKFAIHALVGFDNNVICFLDMYHS